MSMSVWIENILVPHALICTGLGLISFGLRRIAELDGVLRIMYECTLGLRVGRKFLSMAYACAYVRKSSKALLFIFLQRFWWLKRRECGRLHEFQRH
jgi:hypothetical protein